MERVNPFTIHRAPESAVEVPCLGRYELIRPNFWACFRSSILSRAISRAMALNSVPKPTLDGEYCGIGLDVYFVEQPLKPPADALACHAEGPFYLVSIVLAQRPSASDRHPSAPRPDPLAATWSRRTSRKSLSFSVSFMAHPPDQQILTHAGSGRSPGPGSRNSRVMNRQTPVLPGIPCQGDPARRTGPGDQPRPASRWLR